MVKAVQAEEGVEQHFDGLLKARVRAEVGLLVGKPAVGARELVLAVVPTPSAGGGKQALTVSSGAAPAAAGGGSKTRKGGGSSASAGSSNEPPTRIDLDTEGIAEHALQVAMMLPGGLAVLGLYLFAPDSGYSSCGAQLAAILALMAADAATAAAPTPTRATAGAGQQQQPAALLQEQAQLLLLHVDSASRRFAMRACLASSDAATAAASLKPVPDFKFGPALSSLVALRTSHTFDVTLPAVSGSAQLQALLEDAAAAEAARVSAALALLPGCCSASASSPGPAVLQQPLADVLSAARSSSSSASSAASASVSSPVWVDLYCAPPGAASSTHAAPAAAAVTGSSSSSKAGKGGKGGKGGASSGGQLQPSCFGVCRLQGCVQALAYAHRRDPAAKALQQLKADVSRTLAARLSLLADDALAAAEDAAEGARAQDAAAAAAAAAATHPLLATASGARATLVGLPRRVLLPWSPLGLQVCAYLAADEAAADAVERAQQLLPLPDLDASQVQEVEAAPTAAAAAVAATLPGVPLPGAGGGSAGASALSCGSTVAAAAAAGAVAALSVALAFFNLGGGAQQ